MASDSYNPLIFSLAQALVDKQTHSKTVINALELLCNGFAFESAGIYEIDQNNEFHLKESYSSCNYSFISSFNVEALDPNNRLLLARKNLYCISKSPNNTKHASELLKLFPAESITLTSIVDQNMRIQGFIIFFNEKEKKSISSEELATLSVLLPMLGKYVSTRIYQNKLDFAQTSLQNILDNTGIDIYVNDFYSHDILYVNRSMAEPYGGASQFLGKKCWKVLFPGQNGPCEFCPQKKLLDENDNPTKVYSWDYQRPFDGSWFRVFSSAFRWVDGRMAHVVSSANITDNKKNEALIQYLANYDSLTNLPNRRMLVSECQRRIESCGIGSDGKPDQAFVLFFDIDGFKAINDSYGHDAGDEFLVILGKFFSEIPMLKDSIYRNGGDEFVALLGPGLSRSNVRNLVGFIHTRFQKPWVLKNGTVYCNTSVGAACYPDDGQSAEELLRKADQAMYRMKKSGGAGLCFFDENEILNL